MVSAVILTKNEEKNIKDCLERLRWCDEILMIDDDSTDKTAKTAEKLGVKVIKRSLNENFAEQRNFGLENARSGWVLFVDADERVSSALAKEIQKLTHENAVAQESVRGFYLKRLDFFMGRWLEHGEVGGGIRGLGGVKILRLARKDAGKWARRVDEIWKLKGKTKTLRNPLLHYPHQNLTEFLISINERSTLNAEVFFKEGKDLGLFEWFKPLAKFIDNFVLKLGFLDGMEGFVFAVLMSFHSFLVRGKLYLLIKRGKKDQRNLPYPPTGGLGEASKKEKLVFLIWTILVFISYLYFLFQRGVFKWLSWRF